MAVAMKSSIRAGVRASAPARRTTVKVQVSAHPPRALTWLSQGVRWACCPVGCGEQHHRSWQGLLIVGKSLIRRA